MSAGNEREFIDRLQAGGMKRVFVDGSKKQTCTVINDVARILPINQQVTTNEAEYRAILAGLQRAKNLGLREVEILSDSQLAIRQLNTLLGYPTDKKYKIKNKMLAVLAGDVGGMVYWFFDKVKFSWIPREENEAGIILG